LGIEPSFEGCSRVDDEELKVLRGLLLNVDHEEKNLVDLGK